MALTPSHRPTREWPLLILTVALVGVVCIPLWQGLVPDADANLWAHWTAERWGRLLLGPEQIASYFCFTWACFILLSHYLEVRRQRRAQARHASVATIPTRAFCQEARSH